MKRFLPLLFAALAAFVLLLALTPAATATPDDPPIATATDAVFFAQGMVEADLDVAASLALPPNERIPFRHMAHQNQLIGELIERDGWHLAALYFYGRAARFNQAADAAGEP